MKFKWVVNNHQLNIINPSLAGTKHHSFAIINHHLPSSTINHHQPSYTTKTPSPTITNHHSPASTVPYQHQPSLNITSQHCLALSRSSMFWIKSVSLARHPGQNQPWTSGRMTAAPTLHRFIVWLYDGASQSASSHPVQDHNPSDMSVHGVACEPYHWCLAWSVIRITGDCEWTQRHAISKLWPNRKPVRCKGFCGSKPALMHGAPYHQACRCVQEPLVLTCSGFWFNETTCHWSSKEFAM